MLRPDGRLCLASLTFGEAALARVICRLWRTVHRLRPQLVGGCRPLALREYLGSPWTALHAETVCTLGLCTEVVLASPAPRLE